MKTDKLTQIIHNTEQMIADHFKITGKPIISISFSLPPDYEKPYWISNVARETGITILQRTLKRMQAIVDQQTCPNCKHKFDKVYELECDEPFTAPPPYRFKALNVWGWYQNKEIICQGHNYVHFRFDKGEERLVWLKKFDVNKLLEKLLNTIKQMQRYVYFK